jgi:hypothetical protein
MAGNRSKIMQNVHKLCTEIHQISFHFGRKGEKIQIKIMEISSRPLPHPSAETIVETSCRGPAH